MKIYQPMLYVGLGGSGCLIGAELERRLRDELCGPDGTDLRDRLAGRALLPYQLPGCVQFVYADLNEAELLRLRNRVVPGPEHAAAAERTMHLVGDLVPHFDTYPEVARSLRVNVNDYVSAWLPPASWYGVASPARPPAWIRTVSPASPSRHFSPSAHWIPFSARRMIMYVKPGEGAMASADRQAPRVMIG